MQTEWQTSGVIVGLLNGKTLKVPVIQQISCLGVVMLETSQHPGTVDQSFWHSTIWMARTDSDQLMCCPCWRSLFMSHASDMLIGQYSSIDRLKKAFCWLLCVRRKLLDKAGAALCGLITLTEMRNGGTLLIDYAQKSLFERELAALQSAKCVPRSCRICSLSPKMVNVLLVVGTGLDAIPSRIECLAQFVFFIFIETWDQISPFVISSLVTVHHIMPKYQLTSICTENDICLIEK